MISCRATRTRLLDVVRQTANDAVRLEVESHLECCVGCRDDRARWDLVGLLKSQPTKRLTAAAERRIISHLVEAAPRGLVRRTAAPRHLSPGLHGAPRLMVALAVVTLAAGGLSFSLRHGTGGVHRSAPTLVEGQRLEEWESGTISFGGARVEYEPGTTMVVHPARRQLNLSSGIVQIDVTEGLPGRFRVATKAFIVEVLGTRFVVTPTGVQTLRGHVRILDLQGHQLAELQAGDSWTQSTPPPIPEAAPEPLAPPPEPAAPLVFEPAVVPAPLPAPLPTELAAPLPSPSAAVSVLRRRSAAPVITPAAAPVPVMELLSLTRAALAEGDATEARTWIERARSEHPNEAEAATADLLEADAWLVGRQPEQAISAYRGVYRRRPEAAEGEMAAFAVGQLLAERDARVEAAAALNEYLVRYPQGRFVREARERLEQIQPAP